MEDLKIVVSVLGTSFGIVAGIYMLVEVLTSPSAKIKMLAWALGASLAVPVILWPNKVPGYDGTGQLDCGSAFRPKPLPADPACERYTGDMTPEGLINAGLCAIARESRMQECEVKRRAAIQLGLMVGLGCSSMFIVDVIRWRRKLASGAG